MYEACQSLPLRNDGCEFAYGGGNCSYGCYLHDAHGQANSDESMEPMK